MATSRSAPDFPSSTSGIRGQSTSKAVKPTWLLVRWNPADPDPWFPISPTSRGRPIRDAVHETPFTATAQIHPSLWRHTEIATSAPPSASTPAHCPSHFSALAPPDTEVDESEFPLCRGMGVNSHSSTTRRSSRRRLLHWRRHAATRPTEVHLASSDFYCSGYFSVISLLVSHHVAKCDQDDYSCCS